MEQAICTFPFSKDSEDSFRIVLLSDAMYSFKNPPPNNYCNDDSYCVTAHLHKWKGYKLAWKEEEGKVADNVQNATNLFYAQLL